MFRILRTTFSPKLFIPQIRSISEWTQVKSEQIASFLKENGFSEDHIARITRTGLHFDDPQKNITPKFEFFRSLGISNTDLSEFISSNPSLLESSLENQLIPCLHYIKSLLHSDEKVVRMIKERSAILGCSIDKTLVPNISLLNEIGVPESRIQYMLVRHTDACWQRHTRFKSVVKEVTNLGFNPMTRTFLDALRILCVMDKTTLALKWAAYRKLNLSNDDILRAFRAYPRCMTIPEEKITRAVDLLVNKMGLEVVNITTWPAILIYNLEKRTIPRCRVLKVLQSHGVLKKDISLPTYLAISETRFLKKFVRKYEDKVPGLLKIYKGNAVIKSDKGKKTVIPSRWKKKGPLSYGVKIVKEKMLFAKFLNHRWKFPKLVKRRS